METYIIAVAVIIGLSVLGYVIISYLDRCNHKWEINYTTTESKLGQCTRLGNYVDKCTESFINKKHITTMTCSSCGKVKRYVEKISDDHRSKIQHSTKDDTPTKG